MATLTFSHAPMGGGKSLAALVRHHHVTARGLKGMLIVMQPRQEGVVASRVGVSAPANVITTTSDLFAMVADGLRDEDVHHVVADEAHFYAPEQIDQLARVADQLNVPVEAYGLLTDFRTKLFPASARLIELADRHVALPTQPLCACGNIATHNARLVDGVMVTDGDQVLVGDVTGDRVRYEPVCRRCHAVVNDPALVTLP
ncbi:thymidine kinase [Euzebya pacifica]|uniref:thymidine kinase n=1 Tax=Euzebya pacifica TaxID=1608957 RepID=UPI0030F800A1